MIYFAGVMQTGAWVAIGALTLPPKAVSPLRSATALHKTVVFMNQPCPVSFRAQIALFFRGFGFNEGDSDATAV